MVIKQQRSSKKIVHRPIQPRGTNTSSISNSSFSFTPAPAACAPVAPACPINPCPPPPFRSPSSQPPFIRHSTLATLRRRPTARPDAQNDAARHPSSCICPSACRAADTESRCTQFISRLIIRISRFHLFLSPTPYCQHADSNNVASLLSIGVPRLVPIRVEHEDLRFEKHLQHVLRQCYGSLRLLFANNYITDGSTRFLYQLRLVTKLDTPCHMSEQLKRQINEAAKEALGMKSVSVRSTGRTPWWTKDLEHIVEEKKEAYRRTHNTWTEYYKALLTEDRYEFLETRVEILNEDETELPHLHLISTEDVCIELSQMKNVKASGLGNISAELLKAAPSRTVDILLRSDKPDCCWDRSKVVLCCDLAYLLSGAHIFLITIETILESGNVQVQGSNTQTHRQAEENHRSCSGYTDNARNKCTFTSYTSPEPTSEVPKSNTRTKSRNGIHTEKCILKLECQPLKDVHLSIEPRVVARGGESQLRCDYDLEGAALYSVKWYRGRSILNVKSIDHFIAFVFHQQFQLFTYYRWFIRQIFKFGQ
ncbi:unnamed protein product [Acanthoscelides obtectus]|uniref:Ig-like domain-containing protein n=1 Tax=Acanthoscelides obtectus TaxID=200917 RepID=A0A9P0NYB2_ACAOB|nr:unnamed protein product [Acanthoscelides obtectus]CAK1625936.1 hypothetical protein AOBTE_LOCUS3483 [Acanthoscelides obtectus]